MSFDPGAAVEVPRPCWQLGTVEEHDPLDPLARLGFVPVRVALVPRSGAAVEPGRTPSGLEVVWYHGSLLKRAW